MSDKFSHYYHVYADGQWEVPFTDHLHALYSSGLFLNCDRYLGIVGNPGRRDKVKDFVGRQGYEWTIVAEADRGWEQETMNQIDTNKNQKILYCHTKGAANVGWRNTEWRKSMTDGVILGWKRCVDLLDDYQAVGCYWYPGVKAGAPQHFSGTFWWARADYIASLPHPVPARTRWDAEMWIGMGKGQVFDLKPTASMPTTWNNWPDKTPVPQGSVRFMCNARVLQYRPGRMYTAPLTPLLMKVLEKGRDLSLIECSSDELGKKLQYSMEVGKVYDLG